MLLRNTGVSIVVRSIRGDPCGTPPTCKVQSDTLRFHNEIQSSCCLQNKIQIPEKHPSPASRKMNCDHLHERILLVSREKRFKHPRGGGPSIRDVRKGVP